MVFVAAVLVVLIVLGIIEARMHARVRAGIAVRILVNGTRGKTTVTRMLTSALSEAGYTVLGKTTGSEACLVLPDGSIEPVLRKTGFNLVRETVSTFKRAKQLKANAIVIECMAIRPEAQKMMARLVSPTVSIITNARVDHVDLMGDTVESTSEVLLKSVPANGMFYTSDLTFFQENQAILVARGKTAQEKNEALCIKVLSDLGIDENTARRGISKYQPDIGLTGPFYIGERTVINAFAANDEESAREILKSAGDIDQITVIYNNRSDREFRLKYFARLFTDFNVPEVILIGDNLEKCRRYLTKNVLGSMIRTFKGRPEELLELCAVNVFCMGNIKGEGKKFIDFCISQEN